MSMASSAVASVFDYSNKGQFHHRDGGDVLDQYTIFNSSDESSYLNQSDSSFDSPCPKKNKPHDEPSAGNHSPEISDNDLYDTDFLAIQPPVISHNLLGEPVRPITQNWSRYRAISFRDRTERRARGKEVAKTLRSPIQKAPRPCSSLSVSRIPKKLKDLNLDLHLDTFDTLTDCHQVEESLPSTPVDANAFPYTPACTPELDYLMSPVLHSLSYLNAVNTPITPRTWESSSTWNSPANAAQPNYRSSTHDLKSDLHHRASSPVWWSYARLEALTQPSPQPFHQNRHLCTKTVADALHDKLTAKNESLEPCPLKSTVGLMVMMDGSSVQRPFDHGNPETFDPLIEYRLPSPLSPYLAAQPYSLKSTSVLGASKQHIKQASLQSRNTCRLPCLEKSVEISPSAHACKSRQAAGKIRKRRRENKHTRPLQSHAKRSERNNNAIQFINFTPSHGQQLLDGVAPSGSSGTKARREKEARDRERVLSEAAVRAVLEAGGHADELVGLGIWV